MSHSATRQLAFIQQCHQISGSFPLLCQPVFLLIHEHKWLPQNITGSFKGRKERAVRVKSLCPLGTTLIRGKKKCISQQPRSRCPLKSQQPHEWVICLCIQKKKKVLSAIPVNNKCCLLSRHQPLQSPQWCTPRETQVGEKQHTGPQQLKCTSKE